MFVFLHAVCHAHMYEKMEKEVNITGDSRENEQQLPLKLLKKQ